MPASNISAALTPDSLALILNKLDEVQGSLYFLISLSNEERRNLYKAGASRAGSIPVAHQIASGFPHIFPGTFQKAEMDNDVLLLAPLQTIRAELAAMTSAVDDTLLKLSAECMAHVLETYKYAKAAQDGTPGIKPLVEQLAVYFERTNRPVPVTPAN
ncbi:MAG TPA: hypothetical protein VF258_01300 [Luteolibacter sp.]